MKSRFNIPELPDFKKRQLSSGEQGLQINQPTLDDIVHKYGKKTKKSNLIGLSDATGSMSGLWDTTKRHIKEMIKRISELGEFQIKWVAYRDYCDGNNIIQASEWHHHSASLFSFIDAIQCHGGGDAPEAIERALEYAANDQEATRIALIGDAPPHPERDYIAQAQRLAKLQRPVFSFVVGQYPETIATFKKISEITGGISTLLTKTDDLLDLIVITVADDIGGKETIEQYINKYAHQLGTGAKQYAEKLALKAGDDK